MSETPTWLTPGNDAPPAASSAVAMPMELTPAPAPATGASESRAMEDDRDLPQVILMMRMANMGLAVAMVTIAVLTLLSIPSLSTGVLSVYAIMGGSLICCLETQLKFLRVMIAVNYGFLFNSVWRFLFYMILGSVFWSFDTLLGQIIAAATVGVALFNTWILCRYPGYRKIREQIAEEEDKRIEARISKEVKRQAVNQVMKK